MTTFGVACQVAAVHFVTFRDSLPLVINVLIVSPWIIGTHYGRR